MAWLGGFVVMFGFIGLAKVFRLVEKNTQVIQISKSAFSVIGDKDLDDLQKEKELQEYSKKLLGLLFLIIGTTMLAAGIPLALVWLMDSINLLSFDQVIATMGSGYFILAAGAISIMAVLLARKKK